MNTKRLMYVIHVSSAEPFSPFQILLNWKFWINGVVTIIVAVFGLVGNFVSILVLLQPKMRNSFNALLVALCVFDTLFIICNLLTSGPSFGIKDCKLNN